MDYAEYIKAQQDQMQSRVTGGGGSGADYVKLNKPTAIGQYAETFLRILPGAWPEQMPVPWVLTSQHKWLQQGQWVIMVCPREDAALQVGGSQIPEDQLPPCPVCEASAQAFAAMRQTPKKSPEGERFKAIGKKFSSNWRLFMQVLEMQDLHGHFTQGEDGLWVITPKVLSFSRRALNQLQIMLTDFGPMWSPTDGRILRIICTKTGVEDRDVEYDFRGSGDASGLPEGTEAVLGSLLDLNAACRTPPTYQELSASLSLAGGAPGAAPPTPSPYGQPGGYPAAAGALPPAVVPPAGYAQPALPQGYQQPALPPAAAPPGVAPPQLPAAPAAPQGPPPQGLPPTAAPGYPPQAPPGLPPTTAPGYPPQAPPGLPPTTSPGRHGVQPPALPPTAPQPPEQPMQPQTQPSVQPMGVTPVGPPPQRDEPPLPTGPVAPSMTGPIPAAGSYAVINTPPPVALGAPAQPAFAPPDGATPVPPAQAPAPSQAPAAPAALPSPPPIPEPPKPG